MTHFKKPDSGKPDPGKPDVVERYLAGESELSRLYQDAAMEQPTPQFEQTILSAARDAAAQRAPTKVSGWRRFLQAMDRARVPVATAASMVLVVGIAAGVYRQHGLNVPADFDAPSSAAPAAPAAPAPSAPKIIEQREDARVNNRLAAPKVLVKKNGEKTPSPSKAEVLADQGADTATRKEAESKLGKAVTPAPIGAGVEEAAAPLRSKDAPPASVVQEKTLPAAEPALKPNETLQTPKAKQETRSTAGEYVPATPLPEAWLKEIDNLLEQNNLNSARRELKAFKQAYPAYVLPERLKSIELQ